MSMLDKVQTEAVASMASTCNLSISILALVSLLSVFFTPVSAQSGSEINNALNLIADTAKDICGEFDREGSTIASNASGEVSASVLALLKGLADLGIEGDGSFVAVEYANVLQSELSAELQSVRECQLSVFGDLVERLLPSAVSGELGGSETSPAFIGSVGIWIGWGKQGDSEWSIRVSFENPDEPIVSYDSIPCAGVWKPMNVNSFEAQYREILIDGVENCINSGIVIVRLLDSNTMSFSWAGGNQSAAGELKRVAE